MRQRAAEIAGHGVTLVRNGAGMIPLPDGPAYVLSLVPEARIPEDAAGQPTLSAMLRTLQRPARDVLLSAGVLGGGRNRGGAGGGARGLWGRPPPPRPPAGNHSRPLPRRTRHRVVDFRHVPGRTAAIS